MGETLTSCNREQFKHLPSPGIIITRSRYAHEALALADMIYDGDINLSDITISKIESQQECLAGTLCIPKLADVLGSRYRIQFFINQKNIILVDDSDFILGLIGQIRLKKAHQGTTKERFLYNLLTLILSRDLTALGEYEKQLMLLDERVTDGNLEDFDGKLSPLRRELLTLRSYYDELMDLGKALEEDENHFFSKKQVKFFGTVADRADRLLSRTSSLLEYAQQIRDAYQTQVDTRQNDIMRLLTVISTIFFPLTLITSWFGMNFVDMPGLNGGFPAVVVLCIAVLIGTIAVFKKNKLL